MSDTDTAELHEIAQQLRVDSVRMSGRANSGHPTSSMSAADLMAVLVARHLRYDFGNPENPANDHLIFSKGHASPLLYSIYKAAGAVTEEEITTYRTLGSRLEGHPTPIIPWVDVATGSLGQGLPIAVGVALAASRFEQSPSRVWCLCGDSEMAEGSMWEAAEAASFWNLDNLCAIVDVNRLGQSGPTREEWDIDAYARRFEAFGWHVISCDGHDLAAVDAAYTEATATTGKPVVILARTKKGAGVPWVEDQLNAHGKAVERWEEAVEHLGGDRDVSLVPAAPEGAPGKPRPGATGPLELPAYELGEKVATRKAYGDALAAIGEARGDVVVLDGEVSNSTFSEIFRFAHPDRYVECYIAECQMIATAVGMQVRGWVPFASSFAAFLTRAYDFVRMAAVSRARLNVCGSHAGSSIGEDGPSQMGLEDLASFRALHSSIVLYPSDAVSAAALVASMADRESGISYLRTTRGATPVIYGPDESFPIGGSKVVRSSDSDQVTLIGAGITLHEALKAADALAADGVNARVIDLYSVKPIDTATLAAAAQATGGRLVVAEDHWPEGGIGDAVASALAQAGETVTLSHLAVTEMPGSGKPEEIVAAVGIDASAIEAAARKLVG